MSKNYKIPLVVAILQTLVFASMGIWVRMMEDSFTTYQQVYLRVLIAAIVGWVVFAKFMSVKQMQTFVPREWLTYMLRAIMAFGVGVMFFTVAIQNSKYATVSFVASLPALGVLAWVMYREKLARGTLAYIFLSVIGLAMLTQIDFSNFHLGKGELAAVISMIGFDIGYLLSRKHPKVSNTYQDAVLVLAFGWIVPLLAVIMSGESLWPHSVTSVAWVGLIAGVVANVAGMVMVNYVFSHMKAYVVGNIFLLEGVAALVIGLLLYHEKVSFLELLGAAVIIFCAYMVARKDRRGQTVAGED